MLGGPEDHRFVGGREGADPAGRADAAVGFVGDRESEAAADGPAERLVLGQDVGLERVRAGRRGEEHLAAGEVLDDAVTADRGLPALLGTQRSVGSPGCPPGHVDGRGGIDRHLQALQLVGQPRRFGGELLGLPVPRNLAAAELLRGHLAVVGLVADRNTEHPARAAQLVPGGVDGAAHHIRAVLGCPENDRLVGGREGDHPAVGARQARHFADGRETQIAAGRPAQHLVFLQDGPVGEFGPGGRGEEHFAAVEVQGEPVPGGVHVTLAGAERGGVAAGLLPRGHHRRFGVAYRARGGDGRQQYGG